MTSSQQNETFIFHDLETISNKQALAFSIICRTVGLSLGFSYPHIKGVFFVIFFLFFLLVSAAKLGLLILNLYKLIFLNLNALPDIKAF